MRASSSLSEVQRKAAVAWFEKGIAARATAGLLGVPRPPVRGLYLRWRIHGRGVLMTQPPTSYSFEFKLALVERFLAGETGPGLAVEAGLSSPRVLQKWVRAYREEVLMRCARSPKAGRGSPRPRHHRIHRRWNGYGGRTSGCGRRWPTWENCGP